MYFIKLDDWWLGEGGTYSSIEVDCFDSLWTTINSPPIIELGTPLDRLKPAKLIYILL